MNKRDFEILRKVVAPKPIRLGQPPWSEEELTLAYFRNATQTKCKIESRPGAKYSHAIEALELSVSLFKASVESLLSSIKKFRQKSEEPNFGFRVCRFEEERYQLAVRRNLFCASAAALALVEHTRKVQGNLKILGYHERIDQDFKNNIDHLLIQGLRDCILHKRLLPANWQTTVILGEGKETRFFLCKTDLLSWKKWSSPVKKYLHNLDYGVDIEELFIAYRDLVVAFHSWYHDVIELAGDWALKEYQEYQRIIKGIGWRSSYLLLLKIARSAKINPLERLSAYP